jgi:hypothetical protein
MAEHYSNWDNPGQDIIGMSLLLIMPSLWFGNFWIIGIGVPAWLVIRWLYDRWEFYAELRSKKDHIRGEQPQARLLQQQQHQQRKIRLNHAYEQARWELHDRIRKLRGK